MIIDEFIDIKINVGNFKHFRSKLTCLEKYGTEHFVNSDRYKEVMIDKYGVNIPIKSSEEEFKKIKTYEFKGL